MRPFVSFLIERICGGQLFVSCGQFMFRAVIDDQVETDGVDLTNSVLMLDDRTDLDFVTDF